jgi:signal transduction histidine kinase/CheY-like chemotaxis protein
MASEPSPIGRSVRGRVFAQNCVLTLVYVVGAKVGMLANFGHGDITAIWPPTGIALAAVLLFGFHVWPGIAVGAFAIAIGDLPLGAAIGIATGNTLEAVLASWLLRRVVGFRNAMSRLSDVVGLVLLAATTSTMVSATFGVASHYVAGTLPASQLAAAWTTWWLGNAMSALIVAPVLLTWVDGPRLHATPALAVEAASAFGILSFITLVAYGWWPIPAGIRYPLLFVCFPVLIWVALRFGRRGATAANLLIAALALLVMAAGGGPLELGSPLENLFYLDFTLVALGLTGLILAAVVAQRDEVEAALLLSQAHLELAQAQARMGSWEIDVGLERGLWSKGMFPLFDRDPGLGAPTWSEFLELIHPDDREPLGRALGAIAELRGESARENFRTNPDLGEVRHFMATAICIRGEEGRPERFIGTTIDVTDYRRLEAQLVNAQKMEAVGRLAGGIAHDFNNLLTVIFGYSDLLVSALRSDDRSRGLAAKVGETARRAAALTRQLLAFSRRQVMTLTIVDLNRVVSATEEMISRLIGEDITVRVQLDSSLGRVRADVSQVEQVIMNLVVNARDAMPDGGELIIETRNVELAAPVVTDRSTIPAGSYARLVIADSGEGIRDNVLPHIFDPFFTTKEKGKGTGLGLATVYGIVRQLDGHVTVASTAGRGTTFSVYLPVVASEPRAGAAEERAPESEDVPRGSATVLLAEDEDAVRTVIAEALKTLGYEVLAAGDAEEALRLAEARAGRFDVLLTDVVMPGMNGHDLARRVTEIYPDVKVVLMSGYTDDAVLRRAVLAESVPFLQKPFAVEILARTIDEILTPRAPRVAP